MRLRGFPADVLPAGLSGGGGEAVAGAAAPGPLHGSWLATRWQYLSREDTGGAVDVVADLGGTVTLSLSAGTWVLTYDLAGHGSRSMGGTLAIRGEQLELVARGDTRSERVRFRLADETLTLSSEDSGWDFDGDGTEEPASLVAVFVRL